MHFNSCFLKSFVTCHSRRYCARGNSGLLNVALSMWCWLASVALHVLCIQNVLCYASRAGSCSFPRTAYAVELYLKSHVLKSSNSSALNTGKTLNTEQQQLQVILYDQVLIILVKQTGPKKEQFWPDFSETAKYLLVRSSVTCHL